MRYIVLFLCWIIITSVQFTRKTVPIRVIFGVRIGMTNNSQLTEFIAVKYNEEGKVREKRVFGRDDFIRMISGFYPSPYNLKRINYFEQENILGGVFVDSLTREKIPYCPAMDSLWKIRFSTFPFRGGNEDGWSGGMYKPSANQLSYFQDRYNINQMDLDFVVDTNFWNLLRDVQDSTWVAAYRFM